MTVRSTRLTRGVLAVWRRRVPRPAATRPPHAGADRAFVLIAALLLPLMIAASFDFGVTWDERSRHNNGERVLEYLMGERDRAWFDQDTESGMYAGLFDTICAAAERLIPANRYTIRHVVNACFGWLGILFCGRLATRLFGRWAGVLALLLLAGTPRYFADSMNNPKDLPFAALSIVALYYCSLTGPRWPYLSASTTAKAAVSLGLALNVRPAALLYLGYLGVQVAWYALRDAPGPKRLALTAAHLAGLTVATLLIGTMFWPWAQGAPLVRPIQALLGFSEYPYQGRVLFNGLSYRATALPWYYAPEFWLISTPPVVIAGVALSTIRVWRCDLPLRTAALWGAAVFPVAMLIAARSTLYDGIRHLLFTYPIVVVIAAGGWTAALSSARPSLARLAGAALAAGLVNIALFDVRFHPHQTVYFNQLVGGPRGAFGRFDMDYWGNCLREAVEWTAATAERIDRPIVFTGHPWHIAQADAVPWPALSFIRPERLREQITIVLARGTAERVQALERDEEALHRVTAADGTLLCTVLPGPRFAEIAPYLHARPAN